MPSTNSALDELRTRILAQYPILFLRTYEEERWEEELAELALELERGLVTWSVTAGAQPALFTESNHRLDPLTFLDDVERYPSDHLFLLKDLHPFLTDPKVIRKLRDMLPRLVADRKTILMMGPVDVMPIELVKDVATTELPLPGIDDMREELGTVVNELRASGQTLEINEKQEEHLVKAVMGLTAKEARIAFARSLHGVESVTDDVYGMLVSEKRRMVQGSDLLEFFDLDEGIGDIGGLDGLKDWLQQRSEAFSNDAAARGISTPKGVLLAGVQGCGKSLSAKAIARLLGFPLVRMDLSNLLEDTRGTSEQNLREVLNLMETIAPSVLWLEEIDKAFANFDKEGGDATVARLVGRFLTWLQEHTAPVFVVATANNISRLPPELLRRGRFDELIFVDLPNFYERRAIFGIHMKRRGWKPERFDVDALSNETEGYSGAEIEQIVNSAIIESYSLGRMLEQDDLHLMVTRTVPLSVTMEDQIFNLREWARTRCRPATIDSRLVQIMDEEERKGQQNVKDGRGEIPQIKWVQLAEAGQIQPAIIEHIRFCDNVTLPRLLNDFAKYTETSGDSGLVLKADPKVVLWTRMSREFADYLAEFIEGKRLYLNPVKADAYPQDKRPNLGVVEELPAERIAKPMWMPMAFRLIPPKGGSAKFSRVARIKMGKTS